MRSTSPAVSDASGGVSDGELPCRFRSGSFGEQQKGAGLRGLRRPRHGTGRGPTVLRPALPPELFGAVVGIGAGRAAYLQSRARSGPWRLMMMTRNRRGRVLRCCGTAAMFERGAVRFVLRFGREGRRRADLRRTQ